MQQLIKQSAIANSMQQKGREARYAAKNESKTDERADARGSLRAVGQNKRVPKHARQKETARAKQSRVDTPTATHSNGVLNGRFW